MGDYITDDIAYNDLAEKLNKIIKQENGYIYEMLSEEGKRMFMPKGVLTQSAEAKEKKVKYNATIGIAMENGEPMHLKSISDFFHDLNYFENFPYAPSTGIPKIRETWKEKIYLKNPSLRGKEISLPVTTIGLTHAVTIMASLFLSPNDIVLASDKMWGNYKLLLKERKNANLKQYRLFDEKLRLDIDGMRETFTTYAKENDKIFIIMNFPNNPTGYTPLKDEAYQLAEIIKSLPEYDCNVIIFFDDAYYGLFYEEDVFRESLFSQIAGANERILAIKGDAATKEEYVWGFRVGFLTFGAVARNKIRELYYALENKTAGLIRGTVSSPPRPSQEIILKSFLSSIYDDEKNRKEQVLEKRYFKVKEVVHNHKYLDEWDVYPFNSGYFMCLRLKNVNAEVLRKHLLSKYDVGTIAINDSDIRVAFSCLEVEDIEVVFERIYKGIMDLK